LKIDAIEDFGPSCCSSTVFAGVDRHQVLYTLLICVHSNGDTSLGALAMTSIRH
jgi:hypothetical protein